MKVFLLALLVSVSALPAMAQRSTHIGVGGGVAVPVGQFGNTYSPGPEGLVSLVMGPAESPFGVRLDYSYNGFHGQSVGGVQYADSHINAVTGNLVLTARVASAKPYLIGGGGWYPYHDVGDSKRTNAFGVNGGVGVGFPLPGSELGGFIEVRYHVAHASRHLDRRFVPITLGIMF